MRNSHARVRHRAAARFVGGAVVLVLSLCVRAAGLDGPPVHPLDPLSEDEITATVELLKASEHFPAKGLFPIVVLQEPPKAEVLAFSAGSTFRREAFAVVLDRAANRTFEATVDLRGRRVVSWKEVPGVQPLVLDDEYELVPQIVRADARWQEAMRKRGIENPDEVEIDPWAAGRIQLPGQAGARLLRAVCYYKGSASNFFGRPIEGVEALVNMNTRKVVEVVDTGPVPLAPPGQELDPESIGKMRAAPLPLRITQPQGNSFVVHGHEVRWQKWRFRYGMHPREGLVLYAVGYEDGGRVRPVLYRASLSEMAVPYGDPDGHWSWRNAFDVGEYGVGKLASPLESNTDAPENAVFFDAVFANDSGKPERLERAVGLYERDGGLLWKHYDSYVTPRRNQSRRARQLVLGFIATVSNYDYAINWVFHQDGTLELDAALTGIMLPKGVPQETAEDHGASFGHLVAPRIVAPHHQHFFNFRLDLDIDGVKNSVVEMNTRALPDGPGNPLGNGMTMEETVLEREQDAQRDLSMTSARKWRIINPSVKNALGHNTGYILVPGENAVPYALPESSVRKRAGFINHHFWVTRYRAAELNAAGPYPNQSRGGEGLSQWVADNEPIENEDVVVWYTMGVTHIPRPEEWPVMPVTHVGFKLVPAGFFARNPALDVPR